MSNTILLAEDSEDDLVLMRYALEKAEVENPICEVHDGQDAIDYLEGNGPYSDRQRYPLPCLIITDLKMPRVDGLTLLSWLQQREAFKSIPKLVLSASGAENDKNRAAQFGASGYFVKPARIGELVKLVSDIKNDWLSRCSSEPTHEVALCAETQLQSR